MRRTFGFSNPLGYDQFMGVIAQPKAANMSELDVSSWYMDFRPFNISILYSLVPVGQLRFLDLQFEPIVLSFSSP